MVVHNEAGKDGTAENYDGKQRLGRDRQRM